MLRTLWNHFFSFDGHVRRLPYFATGVALVLLKYSLDFTIAARFGEPWRIWYYFLPPSSLSVFGLGADKSQMYLNLWLLAVPFFWIGIALTLRRLRDAGMRLSWVFLFFFPVANLALFAWLSLTPSCDTASLRSVDEAPVPAPTPFRSPAFGIGVATLLGLALTWFSAKILLQYTWGLFLGVPFVCGFVASWFLNSTRVQTVKQTLLCSIVTPLLIGLALIGVRWEGLICLLMAVPLALPFSIAGGLAARQCLLGRDKAVRPPTLTACVAVLPLLMVVEHAARPEPPVRPVVTSIVIAAPAAAVWKNVVAFPPLAPPTDWLFRTGIAYPIGASIVGSGPGAVRHCRFSTGDFVEPITTWDEDHLLAFDVAAQPPSLREVGFGNISTPHIERNYMRSRHGQFRLIAIDANHTLLEGTTWYQDYFWPQLYWRPISDAIVHSIHLRVLEHIKAQAEEAPSEASSRQ